MVKSKFDELLSLLYQLTPKRAAVFLIFCGACKSIGFTKCSGLAAQLSNGRYAYKTIFSINI